MRALYAFAGCAALALPALPAAAAGSDVEVRTSIEKFFADINAGNIAAATGAWRADAVDINPSGMLSGEASIHERISDELKSGLKVEYTIDRIALEGPIAWAAGHYTVTLPSKEGTSTQRQGFSLQVLKREGGAWKLQAVSFTRADPAK